MKKLKLIIKLLSNSIAYSIAKANLFVKVFIIVFAIVLALYGINFSFDLLNKASSWSNILGIGILIALLSVYFVIIYDLITGNFGKKA